MSSLSSGEIAKSAWKQYRVSWGRAEQPPPGNDWSDFIESWASRNALELTEAVDTIAQLRQLSCYICKRSAIDSRGIDTGLLLGVAVNITDSHNTAPCKQSDDEKTYSPFVLTKNSNDDGVSGSSSSVQNSKVVHYQSPPGGVMICWECRRVASRRKRFENGIIPGTGYIVPMATERSAVPGRQILTHIDAEGRRWQITDRIVFPLREELLLVPKYREQFEHLFINQIEEMNGLVQDSFYKYRYADDNAKMFLELRDLLISTSCAILAAQIDAIALYLDETGCKNMQGYSDSLSAFILVLRGVQYFVSRYDTIRQRANELLITFSQNPFAKSSSTNIFVTPRHAAILQLVLCVPMSRRSLALLTLEELTRCSPNGDDEGSDKIDCYNTPSSKNIRQRYAVTRALLDGICTMSLDTLFFYLSIRGGFLPWRDCKNIQDSALKNISIPSLKMWIDASGLTDEITTDQPLQISLQLSTARARLENTDTPALDEQFLNEDLSMLNTGGGEDEEGGESEPGSPRFIDEEIICSPQKCPSVKIRSMLVPCGHYESCGHCAMMRGCCSCCGAVAMATVPWRFLQEESVEKK
jgi:hypothetical protein